MGARRGGANLQESATGLNFRFCISCGRLMGDELGDLCDHCGGEVPTPDPPPPAVKPLYQAPLTWSLIVLNVAWYFVGHKLWSDPWDLFANDGPAVLSGAWWRLVTALFTHEGLDHLLDNMFALWLFGRHVERLLGAWTSLAFYLACGMTGALVSLTFHTEQRAAGASSAIMGLSAAVLIGYATRYRLLTTRQRWKFWIVTAVIVYSLVPETPKTGELKTDLAGHLGGFAAGLVLGYTLISPAGARRQFRLRVMAYALGVLMLAALGVRVHDAYVIHLEAAERALDRGDETAATKELQVAAAMRPRSPLAEVIRARIASAHPVPDDCQTLLSFGGEAKSPQELCSGMECNGKLHSIPMGFGGRRMTYLGHMDGPIPCIEDGDLWAQTTGSVHVEEFDVDGKTVCSTDWKGRSKDKLKGFRSHAPAAPVGPVRSLHSNDPGRGTIGFAECAK